MKINKKMSVIGLLTGFTNGIFGSGGGMFAVPLLKSVGVETKNSHASSIALILPLSIISTFFYAKSGVIDWNLSLKLIPFGLLGAIVGSKILKNISAVWLKKMFGILLIIAGLKILFG